METTTGIIYDTYNMCANRVCDADCDPTSVMNDNMSASFNYTFCGENTTATTVSGYYETTQHTTPAVEFLDPNYYSLPYIIIGTLFQGIILIVGVLGNIMVVIVVFKSRGMRTPTNCYLVSLSVADLMVLMASVPNEIIAYYLLGDKWIWGRIGCALFIFFQYFGINASSLSITAFTVERYIAICHPMRAQKICTVHRAKRIILCVWTFAFIYCSPWLFLTKTKPIFYKGHTDIETCIFALPRQYYKVYYFADMILFYVFPLLLSCVLYGLIARILFNNEMSQKSGHKSRNGDNSYSNSEYKKSSSSNDAARVQVVKMLVVVVAVFATLWLPYRALLVYNSFAEPTYMELWYLMFAKTMIFVNSAINPIIYSACSIKFRRAFKRMLTCEREHSRAHQSRGRTAQYASGLSTTMHLSHNSVRHNTLLSVCTKQQNEEQNV